MGDKVKTYNPIVIDRRLIEVLLKMFPNLLICPHMQVEIIHKLLIKLSILCNLIASKILLLIKLILTIILLIINHLVV